MPVVDEQMICASNLAYAIKIAGEVPELAPFYVGCGLLKPIAAFVTGDELIDAAFVGAGSGGVVLAFRGTLPPGSPDHQQTLHDWMNDFEGVLVAGKQLPGLVHQGFLATLDGLWPEISAAVSRQMAATPGARLTITGHSKGGAVAHLAAARFAQSGTVNGSSISVRTFEGAHPGNQAFADGYAQLVPDAIRYEYKDDLVPHMPPSLAMRHFFKSDALFQKLRAADEAVDYAAAGHLQFIDWNGNMCAQSLTLTAERFLSLTKLLLAAKFDEIVNDHAIGQTSGCLKAIWPAGFAASPAVAAAVSRP